MCVLPWDGCMSRLWRWLGALWDLPARPPCQPSHPGTRAMQQESRSDVGPDSGVFVLQGLDGPDVQRIKELEGYTTAQFRTEVGSASADAMDPGLGLKNALFAATLMLSAQSTRVSRRVVIFTRDDAPAAPGSQTRCGGRMVDS